MKLKKILIPVDFSECSATAFRYAKLLGAKFSSSFVALNVVDIRYVEKIAEVCGERESEVRKKLCFQAKEKFKTFLAENNPEGFAVDELVAVGVPFQTIAFKAQELGVDLIVMGGQGRMGDGQIDKIFFGSKAERVVRILPCPVLCVPKEVAGISKPS